MSAQSLQHLLMRSTLDREFTALLIRSPAEAAAQFDLADEERDFIISLQPRSVKELATGIEAWRRGERPHIPPMPAATVDPATVI